MPAVSRSALDTATVIPLSIRDAAATVPGGITPDIGIIIPADGLLMATTSITFLPAGTSIVQAASTGKPSRVLPT